jgi:recombinase, phage RecT family
MSDIKNKLATKADNQLAENSEPKNMKQWIKMMEPQIAKALPSVITAERFTRMALTAISTNPKLANCTPQSFMGALMNAAQLGLEPNTPLGQAYLIPFKNGKTGNLETQFQIGYKGLIDLAHRSGEFQRIEAKAVYEKDEFSYEFGLNADLVHKPYIGEDRGKVIFYYGIFRLVNGGFGFEIMSVADVEAHAKKFSQSFNNGPWKTNFDEMAKKTVLKKVLKYAPIRADFARQITEDNSIKTDIKSDMSEVEDKNVFEGYYEEIQDDDAPMGDSDSYVPDFVTETEEQA